MKNQNQRFITIALIVIIIFQITRLNTLSLTSSIIENTSTKNTVEEIVSLRERNVKHFKFPDGTVKMVSYPYPVHSLNNEGLWTDISNELTLTEHEYCTENKRISFEKSISNNKKILSINENGYSINMYYVDSKSNLVYSEIKNPAVRYKVDENDSIDEQFEKLKRPSDFSSVIYKNIKNNIDFEYELFSCNVKEKIIVNKNIIDYKFRFAFELCGLDAYLDKNGSVLFKDIISDEIIYRIPAPYMYDASGIVSNNVKYELSKEDNKLIIEIIADSNWINEEERVFPVVIDPTITADYQFCLDTYINSSAGGSNYINSETLWVSTGRKTLLKPIFPELPNGKIVVSAQLNFYYYYYDSVNSGQLDASVYYLNQYVDFYYATWNNTNNINKTFINDLSLSAYENEAKINNPKLASVDITNMYNSLINGNINYYGFEIVRYDGTNSSVIIKSFEAGEYYAAFIIITYKEDQFNIIEEGVYWFSSKATVGPNGRARLMDVEGNSPNNLTEIQQWDSVDPSPEKYRAQLFYIKHISSNIYRIYTYSNPNYCISVQNVNGVHKLVSSSDTLSYYSEWIIQGNNTIGYRLINNATSEVICVSDSINNGLPLELINSNTNSGGRNKWNLNRFDGYELSIVSEFSLDGSAFAPYGHSFLILKNTSKHPAKVGYITVLPENLVTIATYGVQYASGSMGGSNNNEGIFYNRDLYVYDTSPFKCKGHALTTIINDNDLRIINYNYLRNPLYNNWQLQGNNYSNCSHFAQMVWNTATGITVNGYDSYLNVYTPLKLRQSITNYQWYKYPITNLPSTNWYGIYNDVTGKFVYCYNANGDNEALPNVPTD